MATFKKTYRSHVSHIALAATVIASLAPEVVAQSVGGIEEITVTAQKRETRLQSTAASISALSGNDLMQRSIDDVQDLGVMAPSMNVAFYQGEAQIYIRGIGYTGLIGGTESSVATHLDGVYLSRSSAAVPAFFDLERVEVVRGPQGTLYGRNATGGSVNLITKKPTADFTAEASLLAGNYNRYQLFGAVGGPIAGEKVTARLAVQMEDRDGYTTVTRPGGTTDDVEDKNDIAARLSVEFKPSENFRFLLTGDYYEADDAANVWLYIGPGGGTNPFLRQFMAAQGGFAPEPLSRDIGSDIEYRNKPYIWGISGKATWNIGDYTLTSLTGFRKTRPHLFDDLDITIASGVTQLREENHEQFSQEFQISSPSGEKLEWIFGLYYFHVLKDS